MFKGEIILYKLFLKTEEEEFTSKAIWATVFFGDNFFKLPSFISFNA